MGLTLAIENFAALPDGGPLSVSLSGRRGIDIGRDQYLDWTLPDPDRVISGKHAELRHRDGGYWLHDVSRNGTFLNRNPQRLQEPQRLKDGDRIQIGQYLILVRIDGEGATDAGPAAPASAGVPAGEYWDPQGEVPPPIPSRDLRPPAALRPVKPDFIDWAVDLPGERSPAARRAAPPEEAMDWARASPEPSKPQPPPLPTPRRPPEPGKAPLPSWADAPPPGRPELRAAEPAGDNPWGAPAPRLGTPEPLPPMPAPDAPARLRPEEARPPARARPDEDDAGFANPRQPAGPQPDAEAFVRRFAAGLGIPPETLSWQDPGDLAEEAGLLLRLCAENVKQLLAARAESKRAARASSHTMIQALDNNPLKFAPTVDDALRIMLGAPSSGYLEARRAMEAGFRDLKTHQVKTYAAMQNALRLLMEDLGPEGIEASDEKDRGLGGLLGSRKARLWDIYTTRWDALASPHDDGMIDAFMLFFSDCYDNSR
ncbi:hypothetical protein MPOCJGCO_2029 [Methylobacterium trifolii]|uniref:FHA domain-containing protein n=2 Tax=Methylobacterium trifolii TaxID=1003092 RepID=A0ABQ4TZ77_9HYPH|nr:hypothetical protein MPOCJGCO_2029 [Methylobacterium trifolii]